MTSLPPPPAPPGSRSAALDALRAIAIALVFAYHYAVFVSREWTFGWLSEIGWSGVDLFFVLSGYLIGRLLLRERLARDGRFDTGRFYARRACRTLPAYLLTLAAYTLWRAELGGLPPPPLWRFLTFTQNLGLQPGTAFSHAWSLCIEEQFYALLPWVALAWGRPSDPGWRRRAWLTVGLGLAIGITARAVQWMSVGPAAFGETAQYYPRLYYASLCRFDAFLPGLAVALLQLAHPRAWQRVQAHGRALGGLALVAVLLSALALLRGYEDDDGGHGAVMSILGYSTTAIAFALVLAACGCPRSAWSRLRFPGAAPLARWSYSLYLSHKAVAHGLAAPLAAAGAGPGWRLAAIALASLAVGAAMYRLVERPFLRWRDRRWPTGVATSTEAASGSSPSVALPAARLR